MTESLRGRIAVFAGPSLPRHVRPDLPIFAWLPPARAGDGYMIANKGPKLVVLIDGFFDETPAIRHKELLSLMAHGVPVIGGASMGALRAAELASFGMIGVGRIFDAYAGGRLIGDDEVAVMHGPADWDWAPLTEALVNVRATVLAAVRAGCIDAQFGRRLLKTAAQAFFRDRAWPELILSMAADGFEAQSRALEAWLPSGQVDLKRMDALACLDAALAFDGSQQLAPPAPPQTLFATALEGQITRGVRPPETLDARH